MAQSYSSNNTTPKADMSKVTKEQFDSGMIIQAPAPNWSMGVGYWYHDGSEVRWHEGRGDNVKSDWADNLRGTRNTPNEWTGPNFQTSEGESIIEDTTISQESDHQNIIIEKKLYGSTSLGNLVDRNFEEFHKDKKIDLNKFFKSYEELFYDIPKEGDEKSHSMLIQQSSDYLLNFEDPRDKEIEDLEAEIEEMQKRIDELEVPQEHPFYKNGTVLSRDGGGEYWFMEKGKRRKIVGGNPGEVWKSLKGALGWTENQDDFKDGVVTVVPSNILDGIKRTSDLDSEDLTGGKDESARSVVVRVKGDDWKIDPSRWNTKEEYIINLEAQIEEAWTTEEMLSAKYYKYRDDSHYAETEEERLFAEEQAPIFYDELVEVRNRLVRYKRIYDAYSMNGDLTLEGLDEIYERMDEAGDITYAERNQFVGWQRGKFDKVRYEGGNKKVIVEGEGYGAFN